MEIYSHEWMETELGKDIEYSRIFGTFMRMEIPIIEKRRRICIIHRYGHNL